MKFRVVLAVLVLCSIFAAAGSASPAVCSNQTIKGAYAFTIHGQILTPNGPIIVDGIAKTTFNGSGNVAQVDAVALNGDLPLVWRPGTGTYSVSSDCTGIMTLDNPGQPTLHLAILVSRSGDSIHTVVTNPGFAVTSDAERVVQKSDD
jgi:hypothetical protein